MFKRNQSYSSKRNSIYILLTYIIWFYIKLSIFSFNVILIQFETIFKKRRSLRLNYELINSNMIMNIRRAYRDFSKDAT